MPGLPRTRACSAPTAPPIASPIPSATCGAASGCGMPWSTRAHATSRSSGPCSVSTATACPPAVRTGLSTAFGTCPCRAACARWSRRCSPSCVTLTSSSRTGRDDRTLAVQDPRVPRLRSVPGVDPVTTAAFLAAIDEAQRFRHAHQLEAYLGLVPREYSSGETQRRGAITKAGHSRTRWLLIQAAVSLLRRDPPQAEHLRTWARRLAARRGKQV